MRCSDVSHNELRALPGCLNATNLTTMCAPCTLRQHCVTHSVMARGGDCSKAESNKLHGVLPMMPPSLLYLYAPPHLQGRTGSAAELDARIAGS